MDQRSKAQGYARTIARPLDYYPPALPMHYERCWLCYGTGDANMSRWPHSERCALCVGHGRVLVEEIDL